MTRTSISISFKLFEKPQDPIITKSILEANMGNAQARKRIKARDFDYLAKFTGFANEEVN